MLSREFGIPGSVTTEQVRDFTQGLAGSLLLTKAYGLSKTETGYAVSFLGDRARLLTVSSVPQTGGVKLTISCNDQHIYVDVNRFYNTDILKGLEDIIKRDGEQARESAAQPTPPRIAPASPSQDLAFEQLKTGWLYGSTHSEMLGPRDRAAQPAQPQAAPAPPVRPAQQPASAPTKSEYVITFGNDKPIRGVRADQLDDFLGLSRGMFKGDIGSGAIIERGKCYSGHLQCVLVLPDRTELMSATTHDADGKVIVNINAEYDGKSPEGTHGFLKITLENVLTSSAQQAKTERPLPQTLQPKFKPDSGFRKFDHAKDVIPNPSPRDRRLKH